MAHPGATGSPTTDLQLGGAVFNPPIAKRLATSLQFPIGASVTLRFLPALMPGSKSSPRTRSPSAISIRPVHRVRNSALLVIDNAPLQRAAWAEFHAARKRHDKAAGDLHRHEQIDVPEYETWLHRTFPVMISTLRELHQEVLTKARQVQSVQALASLTGRSVKKLWREQKEYEANPEAYDDPPHPDRDDEGDDRQRPPDEDFFGEDRSGRDSHRSYRQSFEPERPPAPSATVMRQAKTIYRRLVQHLHPDRGGAFTPSRKRLWHEIQQAWAARDVDWLSRLEIEWETANEVLGPNSPLSRLRRAIEELHAARRDTEKKLRAYRGSSQWRFTLSERKRATLHRKIEANFAHDLEFLERQRAYLNATIAAWESARPERVRRRQADG